MNGTSVYTYNNAGRLTNDNRKGATRADRPYNYPDANPLNTKLSKVPGKIRGLSIMLHVMAGDTIEISAKAFYNMDNTLPSPGVDVASVLGSAISAITNPAGNVVGEFGNQLASDLGSVASQSSVLQPVLQEDNRQKQTHPQSCINYTLYNSNFEIVAANTGIIPVEDKINSIQTLASDLIVIQEAGFIEIFIDNQSQTPVYFDNFSVTQRNSFTEEVNAYYPYGFIITKLSQERSLAPNYYKWSAKELQGEELGLNWYDHGWRMYDPVVGRWWVPDPLAEKYYNVSPYTYTLNNPIRFIDPDGRDVWEVDKWGHVNWIEESKKHTLYSVDANGKRGNFITLKNRDVFDQLALKRRTADGKVDMRLATGGENSQNDMAQAFLFMADNTKVEWRMDRYMENGENRYALGTKHSEEQTIGTADMGFLAENSIAWIHNHPGTSKLTMQAERSEMGWVTNAQGIRYRWTGDSETKYKSYPNSFYYTYFPQSGRLYSVEGNRMPSFIRNVNSNYKRLFFGTLNTR